MSSGAVFERNRMCLGKIRYRSEKDPSLARRKIRRHRDTVLRVYECPHCGGWHLTSQKKGRTLK